MKKSILISLAAFFAMLLFPAASAGQGAPEKLPVDKQVRVGQLDNGMTYYIMHSENPKQRADFFIVHNVGALQEEDDQNGLAHFLEHMAFNGTKNFPGGKLLEYTASIGVRFGYNVNAYTSRDRTVYNLSNVPLLRKGIIDSALLILHDWSYYISCDPDEIEAERGVIREEWRRGDDVRSRMARMTAAVEFAGSKYARRDVIGDPNIINTFERKTLVDFYHKWYRPDLQAVIVVGDVDIDQMEANIRQTLSSIPKAVNPAPKEIYTIPDAGKPRYTLLTDPETKALSVKMIFTQPYLSPAERETVAATRRNFARAIFLEMVRTRLTEAEKLSDTGYKRSIAVCGNIATCKNTFQMTAIPKEQNMREALVSMLGDVEQIRRFEFTEAEFESAQAKVVRAEKLTIDKLRQTTNTEWAGTLIEHFTRNEPYMTVDDRARIGSEVLAGLKLSDLNKLRNEMVRHESLIVIITSPQEHANKAPSEQSIFALIDSVRGAKIDRQAMASKADQPLFTEELIPGKVVKTGKAPFDATEWTLSNGVKVFWRTVPEVVGQRKFGMYAVNEGGYNRDTDIEGLRMLGNYVRTMGVKDLDRNDTRALTTEHNISMMIGLGQYSSSIVGSVDKEHVETFLQLAHLYLTDPNFSDEVYDKFIAQMREGLEKERSPKAICEDSIKLAKYGDIPHLKRTTLATLDRLDAKSARALYDKEFGNAAEFVFFFAGEMTAAEARPLVEKYIGSLPVVPVKKCPEFDMKLLPGVKDFEYVAKGAVTPKSQIERIYHGKFDYTPQDYATMRYVTYILGARLMKSVREDKGGTYYIGVQNEVEARPSGYCNIIVGFETDPKLREMLLGVVQDEIENLAAAAPTEQEVREAMLYFQKANNENKTKTQKSTSYWLNKMKSQQMDGVDLDKDNEDIFTAVTPEQIRKLTHSILMQGNRFTGVFTQQ